MIIVTLVMLACVGRGGECECDLNGDLTFTGTMHVLGGIADLDAESISNVVDDLVASGMVVRVEITSEVVTNAPDNQNAGLIGGTTWTDDYGWTYPLQSQPEVTRKTIATRVVRKHTLKFSWRGETWYARDDELLSEVEVLLMLRKEWIPVPATAEGE